MGVDISSIVPKRDIELDNLSGKYIAIDAFNILYQFLASIRQPDGTPLKDFNGNVTSHLSGLFYRTLKLMEHGIKPVYVFDGEPPPFKKHEIEKRKERKKEAQVMLEKAKDLELLDKLKTYSQETVRLTHEMVDESKELLSALGVPFVEAPSEGEAQAAFMASSGIVYAAGSQDYDSLLFGAPRLVRNLSITGRRKLPGRDEYISIKPELVELASVLSENGITREQLVMIGLLVGTDFNEGVKGIGPKKALKLVKQFNDLDALLLYVSNHFDHKFEPFIKDVYEFFINPPHKEVTVEEKQLDVNKVVEILVERHDFSKERVERAIDKLKESEDKRKQSTLSSWF